MSPALCSLAYGDWFFGPVPDPDITLTAGAFGNYASPFNVPLPSNVTATDLLIAFVLRGNASQTLTWPSGWTSLLSDSVLGGATTARCFCAYKVIAGGDAEIGASNISVSSTVTSAQYTIVSSIKIPFGKAPEASSASLNANPPSLSPSWGAAIKTLFIPVCYSSGAITAIPSSYSSEQYVEYTSANRYLCVASRLLAAASEDPGSFTTSANITTLTLGVRT